MDIVSIIIASVLIWCVSVFFASLFLYDCGIRDIIYEISKHGSVICKLCVIFAPVFVAVVVVAGLICLPITFISWFKKL